MNIDDYRTKIDSLNTEILQLINQRALIAIKIGKEKHKNNLPITDQKREELILQHLTEVNPGPLSKKAIESIFKIIIKENKALETLIKHK